MQNSDTQTALPKTAGRLGDTAGRIAPLWGTRCSRAAANPWTANSRKTGTWSNSDIRAR